MAEMAGDSESGSFCRWPKVILFGDSLTQHGFGQEGCWASLLAEYLIRKCDVCNRGFSGYVTSWCKLALPRLITTEQAHDVVMFTIFLGANDSNDKEHNPKQHVPVEEYKENLISMVEYLQSIGISKEKIVLIGPPAVDADKWAKIAKVQHTRDVDFTFDLSEPSSSLASRTLDLIFRVRNSRFHFFRKDMKHLADVTSGKSDLLAQEYAKAGDQAAKMAGVEFIDFFTEMKRVESWRDMLSDGLHLSAKGATFLFKLLKPGVDRRTAHLPMVLPDWKDVDHNNPQAAFQSL